MSKAKNVYEAFCEHAAARLRSGEDIDPKELDAYVKFLKEQNVLEEPDVQGEDISPSVLAKFEENLSKQIKDYG